MKQIHSFNKRVSPKYALPKGLVPVKNHEYLRLLLVFELTFYRDWTLTGSTDHSCYFFEVPHLKFNIQLLCKIFSVHHPKGLYTSKRPIQVCYN